MIFSDVVYLIKETPAAAGVFEKKTETERMVFCTVRSVGMTEAYEARSHGLELRYVFDLSDFAEYDGEKKVVYNGKKYSVFRTYRNGQKLEITVVDGSVD